MEDLETYFKKDEEKQLIQQFKVNTSRYNHIFEEITDKLFPKRNTEVNPENVVILICRISSTNFKEC